MPCTITGSLEGDRRLHEEEARLAAEERERHLTQMLCGLCRTLDAARLGELINEVPGLADWWAQHKAIDAKAEV